MKEALALAIGLRIPFWVFATLTIIIGFLAVVALPYLIAALVLWGAVKVARL